MKILLTGSSGQLGREIINLAPNNIDLVTPKRNELNLSDLKMIENKIIFNRETDQENTKKKRKWTRTTTVLERENVGSDFYLK